MIPSVESLAEAGVLFATDVHVAEALTRLASEPSQSVALAIAMASRQVRHGHTCLDLVAPPSFDALLADSDTSDSVRGWDWPSSDSWRAELGASSLVALDSDPPTTAGATGSPLVLDAAGRLYLRRYFEHERALADMLLMRSDALVEVDEAVLADGLSRLFGDATEPPDENDQLRAANTAIRRRLCVVSGGPGTGKTSTVARILVLAVEQARAFGRSDPRIALLAPTGKAAAALADSLTSRLGAIDCADSVRNAVPTAVSTVHRALGRHRRTQIDGPRQERFELTADLVVLDEASMVDLSLMRALIQAIPKDATLVMLGDRDQLASVEAGVVLGDVCNVGGAETSSSPLADCVVRLERSYRFAAESGIAAIVSAIKEGRAEAALGVLADPKWADVEWIESNEAEGTGWPQDIVARVRSGYTPILRAAGPDEALAAQSGYRVLCAHRHGGRGVERLNARVAEWMTAEEPSGAIATLRFRPILVTRNDVATSLFNGDLGVEEAADDPNETRSAFFQGPDGTARRFSRLRLPQHEPVWAMSVHKSQGSEFDEVLVVLPERTSPLVTRELLYTAVSRARHRVCVFGSREVIEAAVTLRVQRCSGLRDRLWA